MSFCDQEIKPDLSPLLFHQQQQKFKRIFLEDVEHSL